MGKKRNIAGFLSGEERQCKIFAVDEGLPFWLVQMLVSLPEQTLTIEKSDDQLQILEEGARERMRVQTATDGETEGIAVICDNPLESLHVQDLLTVAGKKIIDVPESFRFLEEAASNLDSSFSFILYSDQEETCLENCFISYPKSITLLPDILILDQVQMMIMRTGPAFFYNLKGYFCIGGAVELTADVRWGAGREITVRILSKEGVFPGLSAFIKWITGKSDAEELVSWLPDSQEILDAALCGAVIILDEKEGCLKNFTAELQLTLWHMVFLVDFDWADKTIEGSLKTDSPVKISRLFSELTGGSMEAEASVADLELEDCRVKLDLEGQAYGLYCSLKTDWQIGLLRLQNVQMEVQYRREEGICFKLAGMMDLGSGKVLTAGASYDAAADDWVISGGLGLGFGVTVLDLAEALGKAVPGLSLPGFLGCISLQEFQMEYHLAQNSCMVSFKGKAELENPVSLNEIPLLAELLPREFVYEDEGIKVTYRDGSITEGCISLAYSNDNSKEEEPFSTAGTAVVQERQEEKTQGQGETGAICTDEGVRWFDVHKNIGTAALHRVGVSMEDGVIRVLLDAGMKMGPVGVEIKGLTAGYDITDHYITGGLIGLALSYNTEALALEGGIYREKTSAPGIRLKLGGTVTVKAGGWKLSGMASYALLTDNSSSLFLFLNCQAALGGTPAFMLTGLMGGLGINRRLRMPEIGEVETFPLLTMDDKKTGMQILSELESPNGQKEPWLEVRKGDYMAAVGIEFTSFELLHGKLLLSLMLGEEIQAALLGSGEMTFPKGTGRDQAYAYIKIMMAAVLKPGQGIFTLDAAISDDSFLLSRDCHLTGGAAFYTWYGKNPHAGDFVVTVGGYHPAFRIPQHYPTPCRAGFHWKVSSCISAKGEAYLAVTPSCAMAGGSLEFVFEKGDLRAWFTAYADMVMRWHPFFFQAEIGVEVGASCRLNLLFCHKTIKLTLGAALQLWGPPVGGIVTVDLCVLSFDISFGKRRDGECLVLDWKGFCEVLPAPKEIVHVVPREGLQPQQDQEEPWIADSGTFEFATETVIPLGNISVRPMGLPEVFSEDRITVISPDKRQGPPEQFGFETEEIHGDFPEALWGRPIQGTGSPKANMLGGLVKGYRIASPKALNEGAKDIEDYREALITCTKLPNPLAEENQESDMFRPSEGEEAFVCLERIAAEQEKASRLDAATQLAMFYDGPSGDFDLIGKNLYSIFCDRPMFVKGGNRT